MITINLHWWYLPIALVLCGVFLGNYMGERTCDWDMVSPLIGFGVFLIFICSAIGVCVGWYFA